MNRTLSLAATLFATTALLSGCKDSNSDWGSNHNTVTNDDGTSAALVTDNERESGRFFSLKWSSPAFDTEGDEVAAEDISGYKVRYRSAVSGGDYQLLNTPADQTEIEVVADPDVYEVAVAAVDKEGVIGEYIDPVYVNVGE